MNNSNCRIIGVAIVLLLMLGNGCSMLAPDNKWVVIKKGASGYVHSVSRKGENLEMIARWYTGKPENASKIARVNPNVNPDMIEPGTAVFIPGDLLVTTETMPKSRLNEMIRKRTLQKESLRKDRAPKQDGEEEKNEFELFGPR